MGRLIFLCPDCFELMRLASMVAGEKLLPDIAYVGEVTKCDRCGKYTCEVIVVCST